MAAARLSQRWGLPSPPAVVLGKKRKREPSCQRDEACGKCLSRSSVTKRVGAQSRESGLRKRFGHGVGTKPSVTAAASKKEAHEQGQAGNVQETELEHKARHLAQHFKKVCGRCKLLATHTHAGLLVVLFTDLSMAHPLTFMRI